MAVDVATATEAVASVGVRVLQVQTGRTANGQEDPVWRVGILDSSGG